MTVPLNIILPLSSRDEFDSEPQSLSQLKIFQHQVAPKY